MPNSCQTASCRWKCRLHNFHYFVQTSVCWTVTDMQGHDCAIIVVAGGTGSYVVMTSYGVTSDDKFVSWQLSCKFLHDLPPYKISPPFTWTRRLRFGLYSNLDLAQRTVLDALHGRGVLIARNAQITYPFHKFSKNDTLILCDLFHI